MRDAVLLGYPEYREPAMRLASAAGLRYAEVEVHRFPDGESRIRVPDSLPASVVLCRTLNDPNGKLVELLLTAATLRRRGVQHITLVAPYLCYMRQDMAFQPGEAVSQQIVGQWLAAWFDGLVTVDPHLHRVSTLQEAVPLANARALSATVQMADWLQQRVDAPLLVGPDTESRQWVAAIAAHQQLDYCIASKQRQGDRQVQVSMPDCELHGRNVVIVDDIVSSGMTLLATIERLQPLQPASIRVMLVHALFGEQVLTEIQHAGVVEVCSCDSVTHMTNQIELAGLLATALADVP